MPLVGHFAPRRPHAQRHPFALEQRVVRHRQTRPGKRHGILHHQPRHGAFHRPVEFAVNAHPVVGVVGLCQILEHQTRRRLRCQHLPTSRAQLLPLEHVLQGLHQCAGRHRLERHAPAGIRRRALKCEACRRRFVHREHRAAARHRPGRVAQIHPVLARVHTLHAVHVHRVLQSLGRLTTRLHRHRPGDRHPERRSRRTEEPLEAGVPRRLRPDAKHRLLPGQQRLRHRRRNHPRQCPHHQPPRHPVHLHKTPAAVRHRHRHPVGSGIFRLHPAQRQHCLVRSARATRQRTAVPAPLEQQALAHRVQTKHCCIAFVREHRLLRFELCEVCNHAPEARLVERIGQVHIQQHRFAKHLRLPIRRLRHRPVTARVARARRGKHQPSSDCIRRQLRGRLEALGSVVPDAQPLRDPVARPGNGLQRSEPALKPVDRLRLFCKRVCGGGVRGRHFKHTAFHEITQRAAHAHLVRTQVRRSRLNHAERVSEHF